MITDFSYLYHPLYYFWYELQMTAGDARYWADKHQEVIDELNFHIRCENLAYEAYISSLHSDYLDAKYGDFDGYTDDWDVV